VDPNSLNPDTDPDPVFQLNPDPIRIMDFDDQKREKKNTDENFFDQKLQFTYVQATEEPSALKRDYPSLQKIKFINYFYVFGSFLPSWIWIRIRIRIRIHSTAFLYPASQLKDSCAFGT
jgi:hypothetical protein